MRPFRARQVLNVLQSGIGAIKAKASIPGHFISELIQLDGRLRGILQCVRGKTEMECVTVDFNFKSMITNSTC